MKLSIHSIEFGSYHESSVKKEGLPGKEGVSSVVVRFEDLSFITLITFEVGSIVFFRDNLKRVAINVTVKFQAETPISYFEGCFHAQGQSLPLANLAEMYINAYAYTVGAMAWMSKGRTDYFQSEHIPFLSGQSAVGVLRSAYANGHIHGLPSHPPSR